MEGGLPQRHTDPFLFLKLYKPELGALLPPIVCRAGALLQHMGVPPAHRWQGRRIPPAHGCVLPTYCLQGRSVPPAHWCVPPTQCLQGRRFPPAHGCAPPAHCLQGRRVPPTHGCVPPAQCLEGGLPQRHTDPSPLSTLLTQGITVGGIRRRLVELELSSGKCCCLCSAELC